MRLHDTTAGGRARLAAAVAAAAFACAALAGCGGDSTGKAAGPAYTVQSIRAGFVAPGDIGKGAVEFEDPLHGSHVVFTPPDTVPTCPYVQRADDVEGKVQAAVKLAGGNSTGRFIVAQDEPRKDPLPVVTQGAVVFETDTLAEQGMRTVTAESAKCPDAFTVIGGPGIVIGDYTLTSRPIELAGWKGFAQQLAHTSPPEINPDTYDDLVTVVVQKANAILYVGYSQIKQTGERADSSERVEEVLEQSLGRLD